MSENLFEKIPEESRGNFLQELLEYVVQKNGLASIPKPDMEACFVFLYKKYVNRNAGFYELCRVFKIKETKMKSLLALVSLKFSDLDNRSDDEIIIDVLLNAKFTISSFEKNDISFSFTQIESLPILKQRFREVKGTVNYHKESEVMTVNINRLYEVLDNIWDKYYKTEKDLENKTGQEKIELLSKIYGKIGKDIDSEKGSFRPEQKKKITIIYEHLEKIVDVASIISKIDSELIEQVKSY